MKTACPVAKAETARPDAEAAFATFIRRLVQDAATLRAMANPVLLKRYEEAGVIAATSKTPEDFKTYIEKESAKWSKVINDTGAKPD